MELQKYTRATRAWPWFVHNIVSRVIKIDFIIIWICFAEMAGGEFYHLIPKACND